jgi:hypothetical protein
MDKIVYMQLLMETVNPYISWYPVIDETLKKPAFLTAALLAHHVVWPVVGVVQDDEGNAIHYSAGCMLGPLPEDRQPSVEDAINYKGGQLLNVLDNIMTEDEAYEFAYAAAIESIERHKREFLRTHKPRLMMIPIDELFPTQH